jgi:hypothetical protein
MEQSHFSKANIRSAGQEIARLMVPERSLTCSQETDQYLWHRNIMNMK